MVKIVNYVVSDVAFVTINKIGNHIENNIINQLAIIVSSLVTNSAVSLFLEHHHFDSKSKLCDLNFNLIVHVVAVKSDVLLSENRL